MSFTNFSFGNFLHKLQACVYPGYIIPCIIKLNPAKRMKVKHRH